MCRLNICTDEFETCFAFPGYPEPSPAQLIVQFLERSGVSANNVVSLVFKIKSVINNQSCSRFPWIYQRKYALLFVLISESAGDYQCSTAREQAGKEARAAGIACCISAEVELRNFGRQVCYDVWIRLENT